MSLSSVLQLPRSFLSDGLSTLYNSTTIAANNITVYNPISNNNTTPTATDATIITTNASSSSFINYNNSNHNHYHSANQYHQQNHHYHNHHHHQSNQHAWSHSKSKILNAASAFFFGNFNKTNVEEGQQEHQIQGNMIQASASVSSDYNNNYNSNSLWSYLYSEPGNYPMLMSTTSSPTYVPASDYGFGDYDGGIGNIAGNDHSVLDAFVEGSHLWSLLVVGYIVVSIVGVIGNTILLAALCGAGSRSRALPVRNHLMVNLAMADLLVTAVCVPISACAAASHACWPSFLVSWMCQLGPLLQRTPVAASTLSLALLSLDRWAAIRHPRFAQRFRERRFVAMSMAIIWILASLVAAPTFWARQWDESSSIGYWTTTMQHKPSEMLSDKGNSSTWGQWDGGGVCVERWTNIGVKITYAATYLGTAFVSPAVIVAACHASVSHKLTAQLKVLSGATSGDRLITSASRPRPKQVLIVARDPSNNIIPNPLSPPGNQNGAANNPPHGGISHSESLDFIPRPSQSKKLIPCDPNSDDEDDVYVRMQIEADLESFRQLSQLQHSRANASQGSRRGVKSFPTGRSEASVSKANNNNILKAAKRETSIIRAHRRLRNKLNVPSGGTPISLTAKLPSGSLLPTYSSQSFRSRRRAANLLAALAFVFVLCWVPYVVCAILEMFLTDKSVVRLLIPFALFLGHAHSAINPVVSWRLNRSAFVRFQRQSFVSFLPDWLRSCGISRLFCYSCPCTPTCCDNVNEEMSSTPGPRTGPPPLRRAGTRYPGINQNENPFLTTSPLQGSSRTTRYNTGHQNSTRCCGENSEDAIPCCCCFCPSNRMFTRRSSSPDLWNRNTSTNEAALGAFHPKYLNRLPPPDPVSKCHTSHFLR